MTTSYVLVTAAAVVLVEAVLLALLLPRLTNPDQPDSDLAITATRLATEAGKYAARHGGQLPGPSVLQLGATGVELVPGETRTDSQSGALIGQTTGPYRGPREKPRSLALLFDRYGRVMISSFPGQYPVGSKPTGLPYDPGVGPKGRGVATLAGGTVRWLALPVIAGQPTPTPTAPTATPVPRKAPAAPAAATGPPGSPASPVPTVTARPAKGGLVPAYGSVYVQVPGGAATGPTWSDLAPLVRIGLVVLLLSVPAGVVFGLLATRRLVHRLRRLSEVTARIADGDFAQRLPVTGQDEVARLEHSVNLMAEQLTAAMATERRRAGAAARHGERTRIARELHDSISQDLFSLRLLAAGLRRALPAGSPLRPQVETLERTADGTVTEMQALLLELRPVALDDLGLAAALEELCASYRSRLGVPVEADLRPVDLPPAAEHAVLRVAQEAIANAVRHAGPRRVRLWLGVQDGAVVLEVVDDGAGFDPADGAGRHGMGLVTMQERMQELGGAVTVRSAPEHGTSVRASLPRGGPTESLP